MVEVSGVLEICILLPPSNLRRGRTLCIDVVSCIDVVEADGRIEVA